MLSAWGPCAAPCTPCESDFNGDCNVGINDFLDLLANWGSCPEFALAAPLTLEQELADACLDEEDDWEEYYDVMTDEASSQATKDRYDCWMRHYLLECSKCQCPHTGQGSGCPNPDPFH